MYYIALEFKQIELHIVNDSLYGRLSLKIKGINTTIDKRSKIADERL